MGMWTPHYSCGIRRWIPRLMSKRRLRKLTQAQACKHPVSELQQNFCSTSTLILLHFCLHNHSLPESARSHAHPKDSVSAVHCFASAGPAAPAFVLLTAAPFRLPMGSLASFMAEADQGWADKKAGASARGEGGGEAIPERSAREAAGYPPRGVRPVDALLVRDRVQEPCDWVLLLLVSAGTSASECS